MSGFLQDDNGSPSSGRLIAVIGGVVGVVLAFGGAALAYIEVMSQRPTSNGVQLAGLGVTMFTGGALLKGWQKQSEARIQTGTPVSNQQPQGGAMSYGGR